MKNLKIIAMLGHNVPAEEQAQFLAGLRENVTQVNAFDSGTLKDLLHMRAVPTYALLITADTLEEVQALAVETQLSFFERQEEIVDAAARVTTLAIAENPNGAAQAFEGTSSAMAIPWVAGKSYVAGQIVSHQAQDYLVIQPVTAQSHQSPSSEGMLAIYRPIPQIYLGLRVWVYGMNINTGDIVWNAAETAQYKARQPQQPSIYAPGSVGTDALWELLT